jgi:hypothetical protein
MLHQRLASDDDWHTVAFFVEECALQVPRLSIAERGADGAFVDIHGLPTGVAGFNRVTRAAPTDDLMRQVPDDVLRTAIPEPNAAIAVDKINPDRQLFERDPEKAGIFENIG